jgi:hypothetical protein
VSSHHALSRVFLLGRAGQSSGLQPVRVRELALVCLFCLLSSNSDTQPWLPCTSLNCCGIFINRTYSPRNFHLSFGISPAFHRFLEHCEPAGTVMAFLMLLSPKLLIDDIHLTDSRSGLTRYIMGVSNQLSPPLSAPPCSERRGTLTIFPSTLTSFNAGCPPSIPLTTRCARWWPSKLKASASHSRIQ